MAAVNLAFAACQRPLDMSPAVALAVIFRPRMALDLRLDCLYPDPLIRIASACVRAIGLPSRRCLMVCRERCRRLGSGRPHPALVPTAPTRAQLSAKLDRPQLLGAPQAARLRLNAGGGM